MRGRFVYDKPSWALLQFFQDAHSRGIQERLLSRSLLLFLKIARKITKIL